METPLGVVHPWLRDWLHCARNLWRQVGILYTLPVTLCAAFAMFQFKWPSLLQFDEHCNNDVTLSGNLRRHYSHDDVASDSQMRDILDPIKPSELRKAFLAVHSGAQPGKVLEDFVIFGSRTLVCIDGTGLYSSTKVQCPQCCVKKHRSRQYSLLPPVAGCGDRAP